MQESTTPLPPEPNSPDEIKVTIPPTALQADAPKAAAATADAPKAAAATADAPKADDAAAATPTAAEAPLSELPPIPEASVAPAQPAAPPVLPAVPAQPAAPTLPAIPSVPVQPSPATPTISDPVWWHRGIVPLLVLVMVCAAADLMWPYDSYVGLGAGLGCYLWVSALLLLRTDFSRGEYCFLHAFSCVNMLALVMNGSFVNCILSFILPLCVLILPSRNSRGGDAFTRYRTWWGYWLAARSSISGKKTAFPGLRVVLQLFICLLVCLSFFVFFLSIFSGENPVVMQVWAAILEWWNEVVKFISLNNEWWKHGLHWLLGFIVFGLYCLRRASASPEPAMAQPEKPRFFMLPYLPVSILIGINAAFAIVTATDVAYLWFNKVPEGISATSYLYKGAESIMWASCLATAVLVLLFRRRGVARTTVPGLFFGYLLVLQTAMLAVSVFLRLYHQVDTFGFTPQRIQAAEAMFMGLIGLVILIMYMVSGGRFWKHVRICFGTMIVLAIIFSSYSPARLAGNLNLWGVKTHTHWMFTPEEFRSGCFDVRENLAFAWYVYSQDKNDNRLYKEIFSAAGDVKRRAETSSEVWRTFRLSTYEDAPTADEILSKKEAAAEH